MGIWDAIKGLFESALELLHAGLEPLFGVHAWGWAIIALTLVVRVLLLPLAVKQIRSMRAMQQLQPRIKELQKKHKVDRELMRKDPETYKARKQKLNEETMALWKEEGVNPASGCLPLVLQAPIFFALFQVLRDADELRDAPFYFFTEFVSNAEHGVGLGAFVRNTGWPGWLLIVLMAATMFWSQRQMLARNAATAEGPAAQQQKIMMYVMPVFLAFISQGFPLGVLLYWVTTNLWQMAQQAVMLREVEHEVAEQTKPEPKGKGKAGGTAGTSPTPRPKAKPEAKPEGTSTSRKAGKGPKGGGNGTGNGRSPSATPQKKRDHLPKRGDASKR
jgi:YidC/Oxa1 family membrane protein insertase